MSIRRPPGRSSFGVAARRQGRLVAVVSLSRIFKIGARQPPGMPSIMRRLTLPADGRIAMSRVLRCLLAIACSALFLSAVVGGEDTKTVGPAKTPAEIDRLIKQLGSDDFDKREAASSALEAIGESALKALSEAEAGSPDAEVVLRAAQVIKAVNASLNKRMRPFEGHQGWVLSVAFSRDGKHIASASTDHTVKVWDTAKGRELLSLKGHTEHVNSVAFSPDGKRLASTSDDYTVKVWDAMRWQELLTFNGHKDSVYGVAFSPDGKRLATASGDKTVKVWDAEKGQELFPLKAHKDSVYGVAFSPDGKRLASASRDKTVKVWNVGSGQELFTLKGHTDGVSGVAFS